MCQMASVARLASHDVGGGQKSGYLSGVPSQSRVDEVRPQRQDSSIVVPHGGQAPVWPDSRQE